MFVEGDFLDVLIKVRNLIHEGMKLVSHPLGASVRILFSPYRSIIIREENQEIDDFHIEIIENSIINYKKHMSTRKIDIKNSCSYALVDKELLKSALKEIEANLISKLA